MTIWVPMREIQSLKQEQEQLLLDVSCSFMSISNSKWAHEDGVHPCLAPPTPAPQLPPPSVSEVQPPRKCFLEFTILFSRSLPKIISFFPVIALPLPDNCPLPPSHSSKRRHGADMPTPTCLLSLLTVKFPTILHVRVALHPSFHTLLQRTHDGTLPLMTHWHILSSAPLQGAVVCDESFKELAQTLGAGEISCSAIERQSWGEGDGVGGR